MEFKEPPVRTEFARSGAHTGAPSKAPSGETPEAAAGDGSAWPT